MIYYTLVVSKTWRKTFPLPKLIANMIAGGGTTLVEAKLLRRNIIGVDVNDVALERCRKN